MLQSMLEKLRARKEKQNEKNERNNMPTHSPNMNFYGCTFYFICEGENMATLTEIVDSLNTITDALGAVSTKEDEVITAVGLIDLRLDDIRALIAQLRAGVVITQEEIDALAAKVDAVKVTSTDLVAKADQLKTITAAVVTEANETA